MSFLFLTGTKIRKYSATTTGTKSVIKIEIETADTYVLHSILHDLAEAQKAQADAKKSATKPKPKPQEPRQIEHRPMLALPYLKSE